MATLHPARIAAVSTGWSQPSTRSKKPSFPAAMITRKAAAALADYQRLTGEGRLAEAGQKLEELKKTLEELNQRR